MNDSRKKLFIVLAVSMLALGVSAAQRSTQAGGNITGPSATGGNWGSTYAGGGNQGGVIAGPRPGSVSPTQ